MNGQQNGVNVNSIGRKIPRTANRAYRRPLETSGIVAEEEDLDYGKIQDYVVFDDQSEADTRRQSKNHKMMSENDTTSISLDQSHKLSVHYKEPKRTKSKESVYVRLAKNRKKHQCRSILFHSDFNGLLQAEIEKAKMSVELCGPEMEQTQNITSYNSLKHIPEPSTVYNTKKIVPFRGTDKISNSVKSLFPVKFESFCEVEVRNCSSYHF